MLLKYFSLTISMFILFGDTKGQSVFNDSLRWKNYNRQSEKPFTEVKKDWNKQWKSGKDTIRLTHSYSHYRDTGPVLYQKWNVDNKQDFLFIGYYQNGIVHSVDLYLDDLPWESVSLSDASGATHDPGTLKNGNGTKPFMSSAGRSLGFETFRNGHQDGDYLHLDVFGVTGISGHLKYRPECINYEPAFAVKYVMQKDTVEDIVDSSFYFHVLKTQDSIKIISTRPDSLKEQSPMYDLLGEYFRETENVPIGTWRYFNSETNKTLVEIEYDDCGNEITRTYFKENGTVRDKKIFSTTKKSRRIRKQYP